MKKTIMNVLMVIASISMLTGCAPREAAIKTPDQAQEAGTVDDTNEEKDSFQETTQEETDQTPVPQGITVNQIKFEVLDPAALSEQMIADIEAMKVQKGYEYWQQEDGSFIILISSGEKTTGGYAIEVTSIEDNEGMTIITVAETEPEGDMNSQVISYPYVVVKASGITDRFDVRDQSGKEFLRIAQDAAAPEGSGDSGLTDTVLRVDPEYLKPVVGIYQGMMDNHTIEVLVGDVYTPYTAEDIAQYVDGLEKGDKVEITTTVSPSDQILLESIHKVE